MRPFLTVICEDGRTRHAEPFRSYAEARHFADQGHICTNKHTYHEFTWTPIDNDEPPLTKED